jgi:hypothetical protein
MADRSLSLEAMYREVPHLSKAAARSSPEPAKGHGHEPEGEEAACAAFGYLRGLQDWALAVEFRLRTGNAEWFAYSCLVAWRFNPSVGLLLKFTADVTTLVLIRGSNLDALVKGTVNLTDRGLQRHRIVYVKEMDEDELRTAGKAEPTIDGIDIAEFQTAEAQQDWLKKKAPAFLRPQG